MRERRGGVGTSFLLLMLLGSTVLAGCLEPGNVEPGPEGEAPFGAEGNVTDAANVAVVVETEVDPPVTDENLTSLRVELTHVEMQTGQGSWVTLVDEPVTVDLLSGEGNGLQRVLVGAERVDADSVNDLRFQVGAAEATTASGEELDLLVSQEDVRVSTDRTPLGGGVDSAVFIHFRGNEVVNTEGPDTFDPTGATVLVERNVDFTSFQRAGADEEQRGNTTAWSMNGTR